MRNSIVFGLLLLWTVSGLPAQATTCDVNTDGQVDRSDVEQILTSLGQPAAGNLLDADANGNGVIDVLDGRKCALLCRYGSCDLTNHPPQANAGRDRTVPRGETVTLDSSASSDQDGDSLTRQWSLEAPAGSSATLSDPSAVNPSFVVDVDGDYVARLVVNDGVANSAPDTVTISTMGSRPVADAGPSQRASPGQTVTLAGSGSDDDGDQLTFSWDLPRVPAGSSATLSDPSAVNPTFVVDVAGTYVARLVVNDGTFVSEPATVTISTGTPPVANAGPAQTIQPGETVTLDGSNSTDADGDPLTYRWSLPTVPEGSNAGATLSQSAPQAPRATFVPDVLGTYVAQLIVNDGTFDSGPATVTITGDNARPECGITWQIVPGVCTTGFLNQTVTLDGSCRDVDKDPLTYRWSLVTVPAGSGATLSDRTTEDTSFVIDVPGTYIAQLIANDGFQDSRPATATINTVNNRPVADAGPDQVRCLVCEVVTLNGSDSRDPDCDPLTYQWSLTLPAGSEATLSNANTVNPTFLPDVAGTYVAQLIVNDGTLPSLPDTVTIRADTPPVADAGPDETDVTLGKKVTLDGSNSTDADNDPLTYRWSLTRPAGSSVTLSNANTVNPTFVPDVVGNYVAQLIVNDGTFDSEPDTVSVDVFGGPALAPPTNINIIP